MVEETTTTIKKVTTYYQASLDAGSSHHRENYNLDSQSQQKDMSNPSLPALFSNMSITLKEDESKKKDKSKDGLTQQIEKTIDESRSRSTSPFSIHSRNISSSNSSIQSENPSDDENNLNSKNFGDEVIESAETSPLMNASYSRSMSNNGDIKEIIKSERLLDSESEQNDVSSSISVCSNSFEIQSQDSSDDENNLKNGIESTKNSPQMRPLKDVGRIGGQIMINGLKEMNQILTEKCLESMLKTKIFAIISFEPSAKVLLSKMAEGGSAFEASEKEMIEKKLTQIQNDNSYQPLPVPEEQKKTIIECVKSIISCCLNPYCILIGEGLYEGTVEENLIIIANNNSECLKTDGGENFLDEIARTLNQEKYVYGQGGEFYLKDLENKEQIKTKTYQIGKAITKGKGYTLVKSDDVKKIWEALQEGKSYIETAQEEKNCDETGKKEKIAFKFDFSAAEVN